MDVFEIAWNRGVEGSGASCIMCSQITYRINGDLELKEVALKQILTLRLAVTKWLLLTAKCNYV